MGSVRIGDVMRRVKDAVHLDDDTEYNQVTISLNHGGVKLRGTKHGHEIKTKRQYRTHAGHFILSRIDARNAAFGIVPPELEGAIITNDFWTFEIYEALVSREYFHLFTRTDAFLEACVRASTGTTNRQRIQEGFFLDYTFDLPPRDEQDRIVARFEEAEAHWLVAQEELERQRDDLALLRQRILDDAMRGRLVPQDPEDEPASALLERIAAEKERLVKAGTIRRAKKLPPVGAEEQPYKLPSGWTWVRVQTAAARIVDCLHKTPKFLSDETGWFCVDTTCVSSRGIELEKLRNVSLDTYNEWIRRMQPSQGDVLFSREGSIGLTAVVPPSPPMCLGQRMMIFRPHSDISPDYFHTVLRSPTTVRQWSRKVTGTASPHVNIGDIRRFLFPLAPRQEQARICEKVEELMVLCDTLEARLDVARADAEALMQAVLREAFAGAEPVAT